MVLGIIDQPSDPSRHPANLWRILGFPQEPAVTGQAETIHVQQFEDFVREELRLEIDDRWVPGTLLRPNRQGRDGPGILYCHAHGNRYDIGRRELTESRPALLSAYGPTLAARGFTTLCIDMPGFNDRMGEGSESSLSKALLWDGRTLLGRMLRDQTVAFGYLSSRCDADRIGVMGISMGATLAYWLAALDHRIAMAAHLCAFSNLRELIALGGHDLHGPYMTVPGLLRHLDMSDVAAMVSPRLQLVACGSEDPLTPPVALQPALETLREAYARDGAESNLTIIRSEGTGHVETAEMREAVLQLVGHLADTDL